MEAIRFRRLSERQAQPGRHLDQVRRHVQAGRLHRTCHGRHRGLAAGNCHQPWPGDLARRGQLQAALQPLRRLGQRDHRPHEDPLDHDAPGDLTW